MYLHEDKKLFREVIAEVNTQTGVAQSIIEKDYYVTMILKLLSERLPEVVFKGGTSLSKCFHLIDRFSEDIDVTFTEHIGASRRKKLKYDVLKPISEALGMPIENWQAIESDKDYNYYLFSYESVSEDPLEGMLSSVKLETALVSYSFPTEEKAVSSIIYETMKDTAPDLVKNYGLHPFSMKVQSVSRTFIDKIYALCDYYLEGKSLRYSRHMYDLYKLYPAITIDDSFKELAEQVREHRSHMTICPSAKEGMDIKSLAMDFLDKDYYKSDYNTVTRLLISDEVTYEQTVMVLKEIIEKMF